ncbi:hypothetical protein NKR23_g2188 [Pleurostoma richardsiae]|uniref:J domain-containing protein n=1 Tax=Pleurostoma richardsiae TaxID=41990 RepID=A0AA38RQ45_9PEZI|nr:hypothetical protein NKR23_g2188 [Pleurostoma richardsiae]
MTDRAAELATFARDAASSGLDLYELLGVDADTPKEDVHRAWRKRSLKHHPDKAGESYDAEIWERFERARDVLTDPAAKEIYDRSRSAALQRKLATDALSAKRRRLKEELEAAERAAKRPRPEEARRADAEAERERAREAEAGRRHLEERARLRREAEERERERERHVDDRIEELERRLQENAQRREEKARHKAEKKARKSGVHEAPTPKPEMTTQKATPEPEKPSVIPISDGEARTENAAPPPPPPPAAAAPEAAAPSAAAFKDRWAKTKERLMAAEAARQERKRKEAEAQKVA